MQKETKTLVYRQNMSKNELFKVIKAIGLPLAVFGLNIFTISNFAAFGAKLICPLLGAMWSIGFITALLVPIQRHEAISQTIIMCTVYCLTLLGFKIVLGFVSGVSAEMIAASYDQALPTASGNVLPGYVQTALWISSLMIPMTNIGMQVKRVYNFKRANTREKELAKARDTRHAGNSMYNVPRK